MLSLHAPRSKRYTSGFTLLELLLAIAVISMLAAILLPVFAAAREKARQTQCINNLSQIGLAVLQYTQDYDEVYPMGAGVETCSGPGNSSHQTGCGQTAGTPVPVVLNPYLRTSAIWKCPDSVNRDTMAFDYGYAEYLGMQPAGYSASAASGNGNGNGNGGNSGSAGNGNGDNGKGNGGNSGNGNTDNGYGNSGISTSSPAFTSSVSENVAPSQLVMACDIMDAVTALGGAASPTSSPATWANCNPATTQCAGDYATLAPPSYTIKGLKNTWTAAMTTDIVWPAPRHTGKCVFLYTDGHVKTNDVAYEIAHDVSGDPLCEFCNGQ